MAFLSSLNIAGSALSAERLRMDIISQNIANSKVTRTEDGEAYRRQLVVFSENKSFESILKRAMNGEETYLSASEQLKASIRSRIGARGNDVTDTQYKGVVVSEVVEDETDLMPVYDPTHIHADENGYVWYPNVDVAEEQIDLMAATRAYEANLTVINAVKSMASKALQIGK